MASQEITIRVDLAGHLTHHGELMQKTTEVTTWEGAGGGASPSTTVVEFVCVKGCGAVSTLTSREPAT